MKRNLSFAVLLTILMGLLPSAMAYSQTYTISPSDYTGKPSSQYAGSWTGYTTGSNSVWIEAKAEKVNSLIRFYVKKSSGTFQNDGVTFKIMKDVKISGTRVSSEGTQVAEGTINKDSRGKTVTFTPSNGTHEYRAIVYSGSMTFFTEPVTITAKSNEMTEQANLVLTSSPSFGTTNMIKGKSYTFTVKVKNNGSSTWKGGFYLKNGDETLLKWGKSISSGSTVTLTDTYTPTSTGSMTVELFYQTDETGKGRTVPSGSYSNPFTVNVTQSDYTEQANLILTSTPSFGTTNMIKGKSYTFTVNVKNNGSSTWKGGFYLKNGDETLLKWGKSISSGSTVTLTDTYTPTSTGSMTIELFYQTDETGKGRTVPAGSYSNPFTVNVTQSDYTEQANLILTSTPSFGTTNMIKGKSYTFTVNVKNNGSSTWKGGFYLKNGDETLLKWGKSISSGSTVTLTDTYTPTTTGKMTVELFYQTNETGKGRTVPAGSYSNPITVNVTQSDYTEEANLLLQSTPSFGTTSMVKGKSYTFTVKVKNNGSSTWKGGFYLKNGDETLLKWGKSISSGSTVTLTDTYTPTTTGKMTVELFYQTDETGKGRTVPAGSYSNPITVNVTSESTQQANLILYSNPSFGTTNLIKGEEYNFSVKIWNTGDTAWNGSFYLKNGSENLINWWGKEIASGAILTLTGKYTPTTTGNLQLDLFYQTGGIGSGNLINKGNYQNPFNITVSNSNEVTLSAPDYNSISVSGVSSAGVTVNWGEVTGATSYIVQLSASNSFSNPWYGSGAPGRTTSSFTGLQAGTTYYVRIKAKNSSQTSSWTNAYTFKTAAAKSDNELTEPANLYLYDQHGFGTTSMTVNTSYHFKTCIENREDVPWIGHFYLKDGDELIQPWYDVKISKHGAKYLEFDYVPETAGTKSLTLYYQTGKHGRGREVNKSKFGNPLVIQVKESYKSNYDIKLCEAVTCPTSLRLGEKTTLVAKVKNYGTDEWSGTLYLIDNSLALIGATTTIKGGGTYTLTSPVWTPSEGSHSVSVYYKTDNGTLKLIEDNGFTNPIDVIVTSVDVATTKKAEMVYLTKELSPETVNEGAVVGHFYRVTDTNGKPMSNVKAIFNCSSPTYNGEIESTWSESNGVVSISLETDGENAIVKRGETATIAFAGLYNQSNEKIELMNSPSDLAVKLNVYKGPMGTALERIEKVDFTLDLGFSAKSDRNKVFDFGVSVGFPISYGMKWNPDGTTKDITAGAEAKVDVELDAGWTKKTENSWIKSVELGGSLNIGAGIKYSITTPNYKDAAFEMIMKLCEAYEWGTDKVRDFAIKSISSWYYKDRERDVKEEGSLYVQGSLSGKAEFNFLKKPEAAAGKIKQAVKLPTNKFKSFSVGGSSTFKWEPYIVSSDSKKGTYWGTSASAKLKVKGSISNTDINIGDMFGNKSWWKNSKMGKFYEKKLKDFANYETLKSEYNRCWSFKEKEMYEDAAKTKLYEISHTTSYSQGLDFSTKNLKLFEEWSPIGASMGGSKTYSMKLVSKGNWAKFLQDQYNDGSDQSYLKRYWIGRLFPAFKGKTLLSSADEIYGVLEDDVDSPMKNLSIYAGDKSDYPLSDALKMEVSNSSSYNVGVNIPICNWKLVKLNFDVGLTVETECYPSESYYSVVDKCFFPVVLQPVSTVSDVVEYCTNKIADNIKEAFGKDKKIEEGIEKEAGEILKCSEVEPKTGVPFKLTLDKQHRLNSFNRWANSGRARRHPRLAQSVPDDICTLDFTINDGVQNFEEGTKVKYTHYYPAGDLFAVTDKNDTLFVVSDVANLNVTLGSDTLKVSQNGKFRLDTHIGVDDLTPFGLAEDLALDIYRSDENSNIWHYIGKAGSAIDVDELGSYILATPLASDIASPVIIADLDEDTRILYITISDNIGARGNSLQVSINGEKRDVTPLSTSNFEIQLSEEDLEYRLDVYAFVYDIAGNKGELSQMFNLDKPEKISIEDQPDTDISELENTIYTEPVSATSGGDVILSVKMKNSVEAESFQFDLELPEGISVVQDEDGFAEAELSLERTSKKKTDTFTSAFLENGALRVIAGSTGGYSFSGNDGEVATIKLHIDKNVPIGNYPIVLRNISISDTNAESHDVAYVKSTIYIGEGLIGDVNGDDVVNAQDVVDLILYMMGKKQLDFNAADVNRDGVINSADVIMVSNSILKN